LSSDELSSFFAVFKQKKRRLIFVGMRSTYYLFSRKTSNPFVESGFASSNGNKTDQNNQYNPKN
jgi:hypothetical protein